MMFCLLSKCRTDMISGSIFKGPAAKDQCILNAGECTSLLGVYSHILLAPNVTIVKNPSGPLTCPFWVSKNSEDNIRKGRSQPRFETLERARDRLDDRGANLRLGNSQLAGMQNDTHFLTSLHFSGDITSLGIVPYQANTFQCYVCDFQQFLCILQIFICGIRRYP